MCNKKENEKGSEKYLGWRVQQPCLGKMKEQKKVRQPSYSDNHADI
jgi:hypothetical protein